MKGSCLLLFIHLLFFMIMKKVLKLFIFLFLHYSVFTQGTFNQIYRINEYPCAFGGFIVTDSTFYIAGINGNEHYHYNALFAKIDSSGNIQKVREYKGEDNQDVTMWYPTLNKTKDGNIINVGQLNATTTDSSSSYVATILVKIDSQGDTLFWRVYNAKNSISPYMGWAKGLALNLDMGYMIYCSEGDSMVLIKTDSLGKEEQRYLYHFPIRPENTSVSILAEPDSGFILTATLFQGSQNNNNFQGATIIFKIDKNGEILWQYVTDLARNIVAPFISRTSDNNLLIYCVEVIGTYISGGNVDYKQVAYISKLNNTGQKIWEKRVGVPNNDTYLGGMTEVNGNYYFTGNIILPDSNVSQGWLLKMNANGDSLWSQYYTYPDFYGTYSSYWFNRVEPYKGGFLLCGTINNGLSGLNPQSGYWGWLVRTDSMGNVSPLLNTAITEPIQYEQPDMRVFPNPTNGVLHLQLAEALVEDADIVIYTIEGKEMYRSKLRKQSDNTRLYLYHLPQGFYNCVLQVDGNQVYSKSFFKVN